MRVLFIGGTGTISTSISRRLAENGCDLYLLNRGTRNSQLPSNINFIRADIGNEADVSKKLEGMSFDVVCDFIGFVPEQLERDFRLFQNKTKQFMYISSASAYHKPVRNPIITEGTSLANPYWKYSRNKIACEDFLMRMYREHGFPVTIIRPSHTYCELSAPLGIHGRHGSWQVINRMLEGKPIIVHGDGTSLWTMTHSDDFAKGFIGLMGNPQAIGEPFHITSDESLTWNQVYEIIANCLDVPYKPYYVASDYLAKIAPADYDLMGGLIGDKSNTVIFDNSKLKRAVPGFQATIRFEQGIRNTLDYILAHEDCQTLDEEFDHWCDKVIGVLERAKKDILSS